jgi:hypothetical protein
LAFQNQPSTVNKRSFHTSQRTIILEFGIYGNPVDFPNSQFLRVSFLACVTSVVPTHDEDGSAGVSSGAPAQDHFTFQNTKEITDLEFPLGKKVRQAASREQRTDHLNWWALQS